MVWYLFALGSAFFATLSALLGKRSLKDIHAMQFSCVLAILNFLFSIPFIFLADFDISSKVLAVMYLTSVFATLAFLFISKALRHLDISLVSPLMNMNPAILVILAYVFLGERITNIQVAGIFFIMLGAYIIEIDWKKHDILEPFRTVINSRHTHYIFFSALLYSASSIGDKFILSHVNPYTYLVVVQFFIAINFVILITIFHGGITDIAMGYRRAGNWIFLMVFFTLVYRLLQAWAISLALVSLVIPLKRLSTLFSTLIGGQLFHEKGLFKRVIASIIMFIGASMIILGL